MLLVFNRTTQGRAVAPVLVLYEDAMTGAASRTIYFPSLGSLTASSIDSFQLQQVHSGSNTTINTTVNSANGMFAYTTDQGSGVFTIVPAGTIIPAGSTTTTTAYDNFRIEKMFLRASVFYILFFFLLYLIFVPLCMFVDFVDMKETVKHKRVAGREMTHEELQVHDPRPPEELPESNPETDVQPVSYKQFHPIYNIATTQDRPIRLIKLCLYLLNLQHCLFYLVVLYTAVPTPRTAIYAIFMVIPAYILNIFSGYLFGYIKNKLPGKWKFLINLVPPCYWVGWFFLINSWTDIDSPNYQSYLIIFCIVCLFLDQIFDLLQMMIMFFVLR